MSYWVKMQANSGYIWLKCAMITSRQNRDSLHTAMESLMDYYDFFGSIKQVIYQNEYSRLLLVKYKRDLIIVDEYSYKSNWTERGRMRLTKEQIHRLNELI